MIILLILKLQPEKFSTKEITCGQSGKHRHVIILNICASGAGAALAGVL